MRTVTAVLALTLCIATLSPADISPHMSYQGVLKDSGGDVVSDGTYAVTFRLYTVEAGGTAIWTESQSVDVEGGIFNVALGSITSLTTLAFDVPYWLGISVEGEAELSPRVELMSVPYAAHAGFADLGGDEDWTISGDDMYATVSGKVGIGDDTPEWKLDIHRPDSEGSNYIQLTNTTTGDGMWSGLLVGVAPTGTAWVAHSSTGPLSLGHGSAGSSVNVHPSGDVAVGLITTPDAKLDVDGDIKTLGFRMPTGASSGYVMTSDSSGNGSWQPAFGISAGASAAGSAVLDESGEAWVNLPERLLAVRSGDLLYQLTCIGGFAPVFVAEKATDGAFKIAGGEPGMEVSWQVSAE
jgi:hypothetical protein